MNKFNNEPDGNNKTGGLQEPGVRRVDVQDMDWDVELEEALKDFKSSIHAWSKAAYHRPRTLSGDVRRRSWRLAAGWALGCLLVAGSVSGGMFERQHRLELARIAAAQQEVEQQKQLREQQAREEDEEDLLAKVDSDVSREVPSAMEPLAQMMTEDETK
jgi:hypothetical protein